ncbi:MAG TPA: pilin [Wenzhouxiangella sp.]|nr:pilin [Wenzhouxiangella sp.]
MFSTASGFSRTRSNEHGFTLIELMIVVAILAILMAIAIPAYQDYTIRAQVTEGMNLANGAKSAIWDYWSSKGKFPDDNVEAGMPAADSIKGEYVSEVEIDDEGQITITFGADGANKAIKGKTLILKALGTADDASMAWSCNEGDVPVKYRPARCRS